MDIVSLVRQDGLVVLPERIPSAQIEQFNNYLSDKAIWDKHVKYHAQGRPGVPGVSASTCWSMEDVILAPHLFDFAISMFPTVEGIMGILPNLYYINAFTTWPIDGPVQKDIQDFHRDRDDVRFLALFVYCTDILSEEDGPHHFVKTSHLDSDGTPRGDREIVSVFGEAGTVFIADTWGYHCGIRPVSKPRTLFWARWGISERPWAYDWDHLEPIQATKLGNRYPSDARIQNAIKLIATI